MRRNTAIGKNIILFGFKSCGKTFFGKKLSQAINCPLFDTDDQIVQAYAAEHHQILSIRQIYQRLGEDVFRNRENLAIQTLHSITQSVIAIGGGALMNPQNIDRLQDIGCMVYLVAGFETIRKRILDQGIPAFIDPDDPVHALEKIYRERTAIYESIHATRINTDRLTEAEVMEALNYGI